MENLELIFGALLVILVSILWSALVNVAWKPYDTARKLRRQGVSGPEPKFLSGNIEEIKMLKKAAREIVMDTHSHDIVPRVLPEYAKWMSQYGETFFYRFGTQTRLCITNPEQVKQILSTKFGFFPKLDPTPDSLSLLGRGLVVTVGEDWARHRRVVNPAFTVDKLKVMTRKMAECTVSMLDSWSGEIEVNKQFQELTADVISHSAFGSSFKEGKEVFLALKELQVLIIATIFNVKIPGYMYLPTKRNRQRWNLERKIRSTLMSIVQKRLSSSKDSGYGNDLLGLMLESTKNQKKMGLNMDEIVDECKTFFFAGHETTSHLLTWAMFLLSTNQEWQEKLREEVINECGNDVPNADNLSKLKQVTMVLLETLRLYNPVMRMFRKVSQDMDLGGVTVPKNMILTLPIAIIHHSKELWGDDANEFNPSRFEHGVVNAAKHPNAFLGFSFGPRACIGQNFAMMEAKLVIAMILQRFSFSISPEYRHMPADMLTLQPQAGLQIIFKALNN